MSFNISAWSIRKPIPTLVLFIVLTLGGIVCYPMLGIDENPNVDIPTVTVTVTQPGADPTELESQVTKKVEDAVAGLGNIDQVTSTVNDGISRTAVAFVLGTNSDRATNDVRNAVAQVRQNLPQDINDPIVQRVDFSGGPIATYSVFSETRSVAELSNLVDQTLSRAILAVPGVSQVNRIGGIDREIRVNLNPDRLQALGITATQVNDQMRAFNANLPGGRGQVGGSEQSIRTLGSAPDVESLRQYQIALPKGGFTPLSSLGTVTDGAGDVRKMARLDNKPTVAFNVLRSTGTVLVTVVDGVEAAIADFQKTLPSDIKVELINSARADYTRESYFASIEAIVLGAVLAIVTIWVFLRDWRATLITAVALPLSLIPTFIVFKMLGYTLNFMTLLALALVVGILVDDAIVEIENIERHQAMGKSAYHAAIDASDEIGLAVVATTMSIVAVFAPVSLMSGISGQFFRPFGVAVAGSVLFSLLVARTVTPLMAAYLLKDKPHHEQDLSKDRLSFQYRRLLTWSLKHRVITIGLSVAFLIGSFMLVPFIPTGLFTNGDVGLSIINMQLPPGSTIETTDRATQQLTAMLLENPNVASVQTDESVAKATLYAKLKPKGEGRNISQQEFEKDFRAKFREIPGTRLSFDSGGVGGSAKDLSIVLKSEDAAALTKTAQELEKQMQQVPGLVEIASSASLVKPEILIKPDPARAADQGVSVATIARTASLGTIGDNDSSLAKFDLSDRQIPIRVQLDPKYRDDINTIRNLQVQTQAGDLVPLQTVAEVSFGSGPSQIDRYNRSRKIAVEANLQGVALGNALTTVHELPALKNLPPTVQEERFGNAKIQSELFTNVGLALGAAALFIYAVLVLLFGDFLHPLTIMVALPFSLGGALLGLLVTHKEMGLFALIGIVLLMGLVTKNSILLVDYALLNQKEGKPLYKAVLDSGVARLRPILMTTIAMITGMLPIAAGIGAGSEQRAPMAIAVIGGLMTSTLLTLIVVPVIFTYIDALQGFIFGRLLKGATKRRSQDPLQQAAKH
ncbi:MAG: efflux RND transporter permease subunit [Myxacorys chilensis ATA2-1-KO14]|jgi:hydrophobe/amphiphile efflux-1 (HAE1) family protein|nr:efflux RND transporter permease subunit [Myxacorys chilensis ATA2-1-KO14]